MLAETFTSLPRKLDLARPRRAGGARAVRVLYIGQVEQQATNLVPRREMLSPSRSAVLHARRHHREQLVAGLVAEGIVDGLEAVEIDVGERELPIAPARLRHPALHAVAEQDAVWAAR